LRDGEEKLIVREDRVLLDLAIPLDASETVWQPVGKGEVDSFVEVEAVVEAGMVGAREGDDKLVGSLIDDRDADTVLLETTGTHEGDELEHEVGLLLEKFGSGELHGGFELLVVLAGNAVPRFGVAEVVVVYRVGVVVLL
jgi:hypothetical protein